MLFQNHIGFSTAVGPDLTGIRRKMFLFTVSCLIPSLLPLYTGKEASGHREENSQHGPDDLVQTTAFLTTRLQMGGAERSGVERRQWLAAVGPAAAAAAAQSAA